MYSAAYFKIAFFTWNLNLTIRARRYLKFLHTTTTMKAFGFQNYWPVPFPTQSLQISHNLRLENWIEGVKWKSSCKRARLILPEATRLGGMASAETFDRRKKDFVISLFRQTEDPDKLTDFQLTDDDLCDKVLVKSCFFFWTSNRFLLLINYFHELILGGKSLFQPNRVSVKGELDFKCFE